MRSSSSGSDQGRGGAPPPPPEDHEKIEESKPSFRFARVNNSETSTATQPAASSSSAMMSTTLLKPPPASAQRLPPSGGSGRSRSGGDIIDKSQYFRNAAASSSSSSSKSDSALDAFQNNNNNSNWIPTALRPVPAYYPLEKSSRLIEESSPADIAARLSDCLRTLSVQAVYDNDTAHLLSSENVEMQLSLWKTPVLSSTPGVVVEVQRRKGDSIAFHRYARAILDAALGDDALLNSSLPDDVLYSKRVQRLLSLELSKNHDLEEHENAILAIEIAHDLIMKDRMDARQLGLESLCLLTDPKKTGYMTAVLTSHVILLGSTQGVEIPGVQPDEGAVLDESLFQEIRETILGLVQFSRIGDDEHIPDDAANNSNAWAAASSSSSAAAPEAEHMTILHNLALAVLANALDVVENPDVIYSDEPPEDTKPRARLRTASSNDVTNEFLQQTEGLSNKEMLSTLISELGRAHVKPHDATLSAKCLGSLLRASDEAKKRAKELDAKAVVSQALEVGVKTHLKLETECKKVVAALERPPASTDGRPPRQPSSASGGAGYRHDEAAEEEEDEDDDIVEDEDAARV